MLCHTSNFATRRTFTTARCGLIVGPPDGDPRHDFHRPTELPRNERNCAVRARPVHVHAGCTRSVIVCSPARDVAPRRDVCDPFGCARPYGDPRNGQTEPTNRSTVLSPRAIALRMQCTSSTFMRLKHVTLAKDDESIVPGAVRPSLRGYRIDSHRLGFGSLHALFTCRQDGFLPNDSDNALWQELKQERFTTPLLRGWLPCIRKELEIRNLLSRCHTLDCTCCILTATSADLDSIVESGLKNGSIFIQEEAAAL